jgi:hypothetical protein
VQTDKFILCLLLSILRTKKLRSLILKEMLGLGTIKRAQLHDSKNIYDTKYWFFLEGKMNWCSYLRLCLLEAGHQI